MLESSQPFPGLSLQGVGRRRPDGALIVLSWAWVLGCCLLLTTFSFGRDQSIYATVGHGILSGQVPYRDLWDFKPPGIFFVFAAAEALFGQNMAAVRVLEALGLLMTALAMAALAKRWFGSVLPGVFGAAIAATVHLQFDFWHSGQPESFGGMLTVLALYFATTEKQGKLRVLAWAVAGCLLGASSLMKPPLGGAIVVLAAYLVREHLVTDRRGTIVGLIAMGAGVAFPFVACLLWFWAKGGLSAMVWTLRDFVPGYTALGWQGEHHALEMFYYAVVESLTKLSAWIAIGVFAVLLLPRHSPNEMQQILLLFGCAVVHATGVALQAKFFQYHYAATPPLLALAAGLGWYKLWARAWARSSFYPALVASLALLALLMRKPVRDVPGTVLERSWVRLQFLLRQPAYNTRQKLDEALHRAADYDLASNYRVAQWVTAHTDKHDSIVIWGFEPAIYWFTGRRPATRFIYNVPQRSHWQTETSQRLFMDEVYANRPRVVIVQHNDVFPGVTGFVSDSAQDLPRFASLEKYVTQNYALVATVDDFDLFERKSATPAEP